MPDWRGRRAICLSVLLPWHAPVTPFHAFRVSYFYRINGFRFLFNSYFTLPHNFSIYLSLSLSHACMKQLPLYFKFFNASPLPAFKISFLRFSLESESSAMNFVYLSCLLCIPRPMIRPNSLRLLASRQAFYLKLYTCEAHLTR